MSFSMLQLRCRLRGLSRKLLTTADYLAVLNSKGPQFSLKQQRHAEQHLRQRLVEQRTLWKVLGTTRPYVIDVVFNAAGKYVIAVFDPRNVEKYATDADAHRKHVQYARQARMHARGHFRYLVHKGNLVPISHADAPAIQITHREPCLVIDPVGQPVYLFYDYDHLVSPNLLEYLHATAR